MAGNNGKWETVVNKKRSNVTKSDVKKAQQKFIDGESAPKVEIRGENIYIFQYSRSYILSPGKCSSSTYAMY